MRKMHVVGKFQLMPIVNNDEMATAAKLEKEVTEEELKRHSGEFDLECIEFLDLSDRGLTSLGAIPLCSSLRVLHLSCNFLTLTAALGQLTQLEELDLSANHISGVDGIEKLEALRRLDLPGNNIAQLEVLLPLAGLVHLKHFSLQLLGTSLTNPVCSDPSYQTFIRETFPTLTWLDGEKISGPGSEFYTQCHDIGERLEQTDRNGLDDRNGESENKGLESLEDPLAHMTLNDERAAEIVAKLLAECGETSHRLQEHITALRKELAQS